MKKTMSHPNFWIRRLIVAASTASLLAVPALASDDGLGFGQEGGFGSAGGFAPPVSLGDPPVPPPERGTRNDKPVAHSDVPDLPAGRPPQKDSGSASDHVPPLDGLMHNITTPSYDDLLIDLGPNEFEEQNLTRPPSVIIPWMPVVPIPVGGSIGGFGPEQSFSPGSATTIPSPGVLPLVGIAGLALAGRRRR